MRCAVFKSTSALAEKYMQGNTTPPERKTKGGRKDPKDKAPGDNASEGRRPQKKARKDGTRVFEHSFSVVGSLPIAPPHSITSLLHRSSCMVLRTSSQANESCREPRGLVVASLPA